MVILRQLLVLVEGYVQCVKTLDITSLAGNGLRLRSLSLVMAHLILFISNLKIFSFTLILNISPCRVFFIKTFVQTFFVPITQAQPTWGMFRSAPSSGWVSKISCCYWDTLKYLKIKQPFDENIDNNIVHSAAFFCPMKHRPCLSLKGQVHGSAHAHISKCYFSAGTCCIVYGSNMTMSYCHIEPICVLLLAVTWSTYVQIAVN